MSETEQVITRSTPGWLVCLSFVLVGMAYSIVNHEQSMRLFAARSIWDMKMSVVVAGFLLIVLTFFNLMMGVMGRALFPTQESLPVAESLRGTADAIYPILIRDFTTTGLRGVVVAGLLAAAISTYAGIGSAMSALLTRDIYARLFVPYANDQHYVRIGRWMTFAVVAGSFCYVPFLLTSGMLIFYLDLVGAFVVPLLTIYLMGIFTPVHRASGTIGLLVGVLFGAFRLVASKLAVDHGVSLVPPIFLNSFAAYPISFGLTAGAMVLVSLMFGWVTKDEMIPSKTPDWETKTEQQLQLQELQSEALEGRKDWIPQVLGLAVLGLGIVLSFIIYW